MEWEPRCRWAMEGRKSWGSYSLVFTKKTKIVLQPGAFGSLHAPFILLKDSKTILLMKKNCCLNFQRPQYCNIAHLSTECPNSILDWHLKPKGATELGSKQHHTALCL